MPQGKVSKSRAWLGSSLLLAPIYCITTGALEMAGKGWRWHWAKGQAYG